ncbi:lipopolysaccharide heptosyltransferase I [Gammaproteobacteria bacterium]|nr:lipopolysaccharide heptosyltransferase I [Gammaproteobacteria bacterium]
MKPNMHVLIVKVSSLGDVIHTLPALTDAERAIPGIKFDWVTEEAFAEIPAWHAAVNKVIPVAFRRWKKNIIQMLFSNEYKNFKKILKSTQYDLVIDAQGLLKSGYICSLARGKVVGLAKNSVREKAATWFYDESYEVSWQQHAVERTRKLFAQALGYNIENQRVDYALSLEQFNSNKEKVSKSLYFLHGTTWETKLWPEKYWIELGEIAARNSYSINLLWGNQEERLRAKRIADAIPGAKVMSQLTLTEIASQLIQTDVVIAVDTGLAHLAAALDRPTIALYGASDAEKTGTYGKNQVHLSAVFQCSPCLHKKCNYQSKDLNQREKQQVFTINPPCFSTLTPSLVWQNIVELANV